MGENFQQSYNFFTPIGILRIETQANFIISISFTNSLEPVNYSNRNSLLMECVRQLKAYFEGQIYQFNLPLNPKGTSFQKDVWDVLQKIPYGETRSYGKVANIIGGPAITRAIGNANANNPIAILIPCHRVIGANGSLVGYAGGIERKKWLIDHERNHKFGILELFGPEI